MTAVDFDVYQEGYEDCRRLRNLGDDIAAYTHWRPSLLVRCVTRDSDNRRPRHTDTGLAVGLWTINPAVKEALDAWSLRGPVALLLAEADGELCWLLPWLPQQLRAYTGVLYRGIPRHRTDDYWMIAPWAGHIHPSLSLPYILPEYTQGQGVRRE
jgi:hypothetical protein